MARCTATARAWHPAAAAERIHHCHAVSAASCATGLTVAGRYNTCKSYCFASDSSIGITIGPSAQSATIRVPSCVRNTDCYPGPSGFAQFRNSSTGENNGPPAIVQPERNRIALLTRNRTWDFMDYVDHRQDPANTVEKFCIILLDLGSRLSAKDSSSPPNAIM